MKPLLEVRFTSPKAAARKALDRGLQIRKNLEAAVAETVLFGITRVAMDTPVDTGRARACIAGEFSEVVDISGPAVSAEAVAEGKAASVTRLDVANLEGQFGGHLEYLPHLEFGHVIKVKAVTGRVYAKVDSEGKARRVSGKAMFRKNAPVIRAYFRRRCQQAVQYGLKGQQLPPAGTE